MNCPTQSVRWSKSSIKKRIVVRRTVRSMLGEQTFAQLRTGLTVRILDSSARDPEFQSHALEAAWSVARITKRVMFDVCLHVSSPGNILLPRDDKSCWKIHSVHDLSLFRQYHYNLFFLFSSHACVCVCMRACMHVCLCVYIKKITSANLTKPWPKIAGPK